MDRRQNDKALFVLLYKPVHRLILVLIEPHFLPDALEVQTDRRVADHHLKEDFGDLLDKFLYLRSGSRVPVLD